MSRGRALAARFRIRDWVRATIRDFHQWNRMLDALDLIGRNIRDEIVRHPRASDGRAAGCDFPDRNVKKLGAVGRSSFAKGSVEAVRACDRCRTERGEHRSVPLSGKRGRR
jgi:hypothetical protein